MYFNRFFIDTVFAILAALYLVPTYDGFIFGMIVVIWLGVDAINIVRKKLIYLV